MGLEFKRTKGRLNVTDNGNGQMAIYGEDLKAIAFIPKDHEESEHYINLFKSAPDLLEALQEILKWSAHFPEAMNEDIIKAKQAIEKALR